VPAPARPFHAFNQRESDKKKEKKKFFKSIGAPVTSVWPPAATVGLFDVSNCKPPGNSNSVDMKAENVGANAFFFFFW
jgi:hypothetical protein